LKLKQNMILKEFYLNNIVPQLKDKFGYKNALATPKLIKAVVNVGLSASQKDKQFQQNIVENLMVITGQKPVLTKSKLSIAGFGIREGLVVGAKVTLRGKRMYDLVSKIIDSVLPRVRDFQGLEKSSIDSRGNLTLGFKENTVFSEINPEKSSTIHGLEISIVSNAKSRDEGMALFQLLKFPFKTGPESTKKRTGNKKNKKTPK